MEDIAQQHLSYIRSVAQNVSRQWWSTRWCSWPVLDCIDELMFQKELGQPPDPHPKFSKIFMVWKIVFVISSFDIWWKIYFALCTFNRGDLKAYNCVLTRGKGLLIVIRLIGPCDYSAARGPNLKTHDQRSHTLERPFTQITHWSYEFCLIKLLQENLSQNPTNLPTLLIWIPY